MGGVGNIETLRSEILKQAKEQASTILDREQRVKERDLEFAREDANTIREQERSKLQPLIETEEKKISSAAEMEARRMLLDKKEELVSRLFDEAEAKLEEMRNSKLYTDVISKSIENAVANIGDDLIVEFGDKDKAVFDKNVSSLIELNVSKATGKKVKLQFRAAGDSISAGVIIKSKDERMIIDSSFTNLIKRLKEDIRGKVSEILLQE